MKFRKKPVVIEAIQFTGSNHADLVHWMGFRPLGHNYTPDVLHIATLEGVMIAGPLDWIIKGVNGEFYPCKPDIFEKTYDPVEE